MVDNCVNSELVYEFIDQSLDELKSLDPLFVALEKDPADREIVQNIFRPVHTIKGNASFFGFMGIKKLSHQLETVLDGVRKGKRTVDGELISLLLRTLDMLKGMFERVRREETEVPDPDGFEALMRDLRQSLDAAALSPKELWPGVFTKLQTLREIIPESEEGQRRAWSSLSEALEQLSAVSGFRKSKKEENRFARAALKIFTSLEKNGENEDDMTQLEEVIETALEESNTESARNTVAEIKDVFVTLRDTMGYDPLMQDEVLDKLTGISEREFTSPKTAANQNMDRNKTQRPAADTPTGARSRPDKTMRVPESQIDRFLSYVGELIVVGDMFQNLQYQLSALEGVGDLSVNFRRTNETFGKLSENMRKSIMKLRSVPADRLLSKANRLVRDIAGKEKKKIRVEISGGELDIDKSYIELLDAPFTHMVRNAADHGIELPEDRTSAGKEETGTVRVAMEAVDNYFYLKISDDGAGIDRDAVQKKAAEMGLMRQGKDFDSTDLLQLIFQSGVSTARNVTDISGRGVGMDVVKKAIEAAGGKIDIRTESGRGSEFSIRLPRAVTTEIIDGYIVRCADQDFVLPLESVIETAAIEKEAFHTVAGGGRCVNRHGNVIRALSLRETLGVDDSDMASASRHVTVTVRSGREKLTLVIDDVIGVQQVVIHAIKGISEMDELIKGAALRGNGSVALILDVDRIRQKT